MKGKTICKTLGLVLLALLILVVLYVVYVFAIYHRVGDQNLSVMHCSSRDAVPMEDAVETGEISMFVGSDFVVSDGDALATTTTSAATVAASAPCSW